MTEAFESLTIEHKGSVSTVTISRPPLNTVTPAALHELSRAFSDLGARDETRAIILTGSGTRAFCAGAALEEHRPSGGAAAGDAFREVGRSVVHGIETCPKPVLAAIRGWCIGGGFAIAQACDVRMASASAKFRTGDAYVGLVPSWGMSLVRLVHWIGRNRALDMLMMGEDLPASEAKELGLLTRVVEDDLFDATVAQMSERLASGSPLVFRAIKEAMRSQYFESPAAAAHLETYWATKSRSSNDAAEGIAAFKEKRKPKFRGD